MIAALADVPDVAGAIDLVVPFHPQSGPMLASLPTLPEKPSQDLPT
jgi:hypothetical protein